MKEYKLRDMSGRTLTVKATSRLKAIKEGQAITGQYVQIDEKITIKR